MAIEIIPKTRTRKISLTKTSSFVLAIIFFAFLISYFVFNFYQNKLSREISDVEKALQKSPSENNLEDGIFSYQKKIEDTGILLGNHKPVANLLSNLEKNTHPKVWLSRFKLNMADETLDLLGSTDSFEILGQQTLIFGKQEFIKNTNLSDVSMGRDGKIKFELQLILDPKIFAPLTP